MFDQLNSLLKNGEGSFFDLNHIMAGSLSTPCVLCLGVITELGFVKYY